MKYLILFLISFNLNAKPNSIHCAYKKQFGEVISSSAGVNYEKLYNELSPSDKALVDAKGLECDAELAARIAIANARENEIASERAAMKAADIDNLNPAEQLRFLKELIREYVERNGN